MKSLNKHNKSGFSSQCIISFFMYTYIYFIFIVLLSETLKSTSNKHKHVLLLTVLQYDRNEMLSRNEILSALECALEYGCFEICFNYFGKYAFGYWAYLYFIVSHLSGTFLRCIFKMFLKKCNSSWVCADFGFTKTRRWCLSLNCVDGLKNLLKDFVWVSKDD